MEPTSTQATNTQATNTQNRIDRRILAYYGGEFDEASRLTTRSVAGRIELIRMAELLAPLLTTPRRILDVGGATGIHASWLAEAGHEVTLVDLVPDHIARAAEHGGFRALVGDARALEQPTDSVDLTLLLGPLYHLVSREDRVKALREAARVTRPGGRVVAMVIPRWAALSDSISGWPDGGRAGGWLHELLDTGDFVPDDRGFPAGHFHTAAEFERELMDAGLVDLALEAVEGSVIGLESVATASDEAVQAALTLVRETGRLVGSRELSIHLLGTGRVCG